MSYKNWGSGAGRKKNGPPSDPLEQKEYYKNKLLNLLTRRKTVKEAGDYLKRWGCSSEMTEELLNFAIEYGFLDDLDYAACFIRESANEKYHSLRKIRYDLTLKGVDRERIDEALEKAEISDEEILKRLIEHKIKNPEELSDERLRNKIMNYCVSHGFSFELVRAAIDNGEKML